MINHNRRSPSAHAIGGVLVDWNSALQETADQAAEAYRLAETLYKEGETSLLDLLTARHRTIGTRSDLSTVEPLLPRRRVNLNPALGGSWR